MRVTPDNTTPHTHKRAKKKKRKNPLFDTRPAVPRTNRISCSSPDDRTKPRRDFGILLYKERGGWMRFSWSCRTACVRRKLGQSQQYKKKLRSSSANTVLRVLQLDITAVASRLCHLTLLRLSSSCLLSTRAQAVCSPTIAAVPYLLRCASPRSSPATSNGLRAWSCKYCCNYY